MWQSGTFRIGHLGGIAIDVHITLGLVFVWGAWQGWAQSATLEGALYGIVAMLLLFGCILLHELAHSWQARVFKLTVRRIILLPIGGLTELETPASHAWHELAVAFAGPLVNLGLAGGLAAIFLVTGFGVLANSQAADFLFPQPGLSGLIIYLIGANLLLFLFNMIPAFPMDGGRILRAGLALATSYLTATRIAAWVGRAIGVGMFALGLAGWPPFSRLPNVPLMIVAMGVFMGAHSEEIMVLRRWALARVNVGDVINRPPKALAPWDNLSQPLIAQLFSADRVMPVVVEGRLVGLLTYREARRHAGRNQQATVAHAMRTSFPSLQLRDTLWVALQQMSATRLAALPVVNGVELMGMITLDDVNDAWKYAPNAR